MLKPLAYQHSQSKHMLAGVWEAASVPLWFAYRSVLWWLRMMQDAI